MLAFDSIDLDVDQDLAVPSLHRNLGEEVQLPPAAGLPVEEQLLVQEDRLVRAEVPGRVRGGEVEEVTEEGRDQALGERVVAHRSFSEG